MVVKPPKYFVGVDLAPRRYREQGGETGVVLMRVNQDGTKEVIDCPEHIRQRVLEECMERPGVDEYGGDFITEINDIEEKKKP